MAAALDRRSLVRAALRAGAVLGGAKIVILAAAHVAFGVAALVSAATGVVLWAVTIAVLLLAALHLRREAGGFQPYTRVLFHLALVWASGQFLFTGFSILLFHVLEPSLLDATVEPMREIARQINERLGTEPNEIELRVQAITRETSPFSVMGQLRGYRDSLLPGIVLSAVIAIPFRARPSQAPFEAPADPPSA